MELMEQETWLNAEDAMRWNFITGTVEELKLAAHYDLSKFRFRNMPQQKIEEPEAKKTPRPDPVSEAIKRRHESYVKKYETETGE